MESGQRFGPSADEGNRTKALIKPTRDTVTGPVGRLRDEFDGDPVS
jgi:hypothetical protein